MLSKLPYDDRSANASLLAQSGNLSLVAGRDRQSSYPFLGPRCDDGVARSVVVRQLEKHKPPPPALPHIQADEGVRDALKRCLKRYIYCHQLRVCLCASGSAH